jgi:hypothetical protein
MNWNLTDFTKVAAITVAGFGLFRVVLGRPLLRNIINPHRLTWLLVALGFFVGAVGLLHDETQSSNPTAWFAPLKTLVLEERATGPVMIAGFAILNGLAVVGSVLYCLAQLPRDPRSFRKREDLPKAVQYYTALHGGMDFAAVIRLPSEETAKPEVVATGVNRTEIQDRLNATSHKETADARIQKWLDLAVELHREFQRMNSMLHPGGQGENRRVLLDVQFGGYLLQYVRPPRAGGDVLFVFAVTVLQQEVTTRQFEEHFELLMQAIRNITSGVERM